MRIGYPPSTRLSDLEYVAFDTETTGLSPVVARLLELSGTRFQLCGSLQSRTCSQPQDSRILHSGSGADDAGSARSACLNSFSRLIDPGIPIPADATAIHGITDEMVNGQPDFKEALSSFLNWIEPDRTVLVAHNAPFDLAFLEVALVRMQLPPPAIPVLDTLTMARSLLPGAPTYKLKGLIDFLGLRSGEFHRALEDSQHVAGLFTRLLSMIPQTETWSDLTRLFPPLFFTDRRKQSFTKNTRLRAQYNDLVAAIADQQPVRITYRGERTTERIITPHAVHCWGQTFYLEAYCHGTESTRTFRLDRILEHSLAAAPTSTQGSQEGD